VGFLGGFTTFSSFALEGYSLVHSHNLLAAGAYVMLTNVMGFAAVWAGHRLVA
jgi:CrcB protein